MPELLRELCDARTVNHRNLLMFPRYVAAIFAGIAIAQPLAAQARRNTLTGRVIDSTSALPILRATVTASSSGQRAMTGRDGGFVLRDLTDGTARITVSRIGFISQTRELALIAGQSAAVQFAMERDASNSGAVVLTGYGSQQAMSLTGAVETIDARDANVGAIANPSAMLTARAAGVSVTLNNGEPGANSQIRIRGGSSIGVSNDPLYVIDGLPLQNLPQESPGLGIGGTPALARDPLNGINPADIASVTVLKDASATAIYGSRGANGVVLIQTKRGRAAGPRMEYATYLALGTAAKQLGFLSGDQYRTFVQSQVNSGRLPSSRLAQLGTASTNWERETERSSLTQSHDVSFTGGSERTALRASVNFAGHQGIVLSSGFTRLQARINGSHDALRGRLRIGVNLSSVRIKNDYVPYENTGGFDGGVLQNVAVFNPTQPVYFSSATAGGASFYEIGPGRQSVRNPVALASQLRDDGSTTQTLANTTTSFAIIPSVIAQLNIGGENSRGTRRIYWPRASPVGAEFNGLAQRAERNASTRNLQSLLTWSPRTGPDYEFDVLGGYEYSSFNYDELIQQSRDFATDASGYNNLGAGAQAQVPSSASSTSHLRSFFSRTGAAYKNRYFLSGSLRWDAAPNGAAGEMRAVSPAVSGMWRITEEAFGKRLPFSQLSLRASYGRQSNQSPFLGLSTLPASRLGLSRAPINARVTAAPATAAGTLGPETVAQSNIAMDFGLLHDRVSGSIELFRKKTTDLLLLVPISPSIGATFQNIGAISEKGLELSLDAQLIRRGADRFNFASGLVLTVERTKVLSLGAADFIETSGVSGQGQSGVNAQRIIPGQPLGTFYGWQFAGLNAAGNQTFNSYTVTRDAQGKETRRVSNGVTTAPTADDKVVIGNASPSFIIGLRSNLRWHRVDASWLWRAEHGQDVFNNTALTFSTKSNVQQDRNFLASALGTAESISEPSIYSSRWIEDGSFLRLQNITVGYSFNVPGSQRPVRVFLSGDNLLLITKYTGYDPEVFIDAGLASRGVDYLSYPRARTVSTGLSIRF